MTGEQQLLEIIKRVKPLTGRLVDKIDACPHGGAIIGYLLELRRVLLKASETRTFRHPDDALVLAIERFITEVTEYGLDG